MAISALSNIGLPAASTAPERLSDADKARIAEMFHLKAELGNSVWPGWGDAEIPVILHNEAYAFLLGYPGDPPMGWKEAPSTDSRGQAWEVTPNDSFLGKPYYRQPLTDRQATPENFTVLVGERWVATLFTREYARVAFYTGFRKELPGILQPFLPYRFLWKLLMGLTETYVEGLAHESFHAFQGINVPDRLFAAEKIASAESAYPWDNPNAEAAWKTELDLLHQAVTASTDEQAVELTRQFLEQRESRRQIEVFSSKIIDYERKREWLEGLAKYAELSLGLAAARSSNYQPIPQIKADQDFKNYSTQENFWRQQVNEIKHQSSQHGESRFYYSGMAQAVLLDRLQPGWKSDIWQESVWLEELLIEAVSSKQGLELAPIKIGEAFLWFRSYRLQS
jgi:hypothetical protein